MGGSKPTVISVDESNSKYLLVQYIPVRTATVRMNLSLVVANINHRKLSLSSILDLGIHRLGFIG